jgi:hypothetical protein
MFRCPVSDNVSACLKNARVVDLGFRDGDT